MTSILDIFDDVPEDPPIPESESAKEFMSAFYDWLEAPDGFAEEAEERAPGLHCSSLWKVCARERMLTHYLRVEGELVEEQLRAGQHLTFAVGHALHHWWQNQLLGPWGRLLGDWRCIRCDKITVKNGTMPKACPECGAHRREALIYAETFVVDDKLRYCGHCDGKILLGDEPAVFEFKTMSHTQYDKLIRPKPSHVIQVHAYMHALGLTNALIVYQNKGSQAKWSKDAGKWICGTPKIKAYKVPFDRDLWHEMKVRISDYHRAGDEIERLPVVSEEDVARYTRICAHENAMLAVDCPVRDECFSR